MKFVIGKVKEQRETDDTLFGLLSQHKGHHTYVRILVNEKERRISLQFTDNPRHWGNIAGDRYSGYRLLKRSELGVSKLSLKYITPQQVVTHFGPTLGIKLPMKRNEVLNMLDDPDKRYFCLDASMKYLQNIAISVKKIINMTPQKKYELIETYLAAQPSGSAGN